MCVTCVGSLVIVLLVFIIQILCVCCGVCLFDFICQLFGWLRRLDCCLLGLVIRYVFGYFVRKTNCLLFAYCLGYGVWFTVFCLVIIWVLLFGCSAWFEVFGCCCYVYWFVVCLWLRLV